MDAPRMGRRTHSAKCSRRRETFVFWKGFLAAQKPLGMKLTDHVQVTDDGALADDSLPSLDYMPPQKDDDQSASTQRHENEGG